YWPGHVVMILCVSFAVGLGLWQLEAWQTRRADAAVDISNSEPVTLDSVMTGNELSPVITESSVTGRSVGRPVTFSGTWMPGSTLYIEDRKLDGDEGYWVVTPVRVQGSESAIPVVRGWSASATSTAPSGSVAVTGWLQATEGSGPLDEDPHDDVLTGMRLASMVEHVDADLYSAYVVARDLTGQGAADGTALRSVSASAVPDVSGFTALRNFLYAVEWWVFGAFAFFVWFRWCKDSLEVEEAVEAAVEEDA
ncbi:MAG: SURF1 family protein, partial [Actinomycetales bacterium]